MNIKNITLMELCERNCFTDSEGESSNSDKEDDGIIKRQPLDTKTHTRDDKITIIVDGFYNNKAEEKHDDDGWENIEFAELGDVISDPSLNLTTVKKKI